MKGWLTVLILFSAFSLFAQEKKIVTPHHVKGQFAGGIGMISAGAGYRFGKAQLEGDMYFGIVPKAYAGEQLEIITGKLTWFPGRRKRISSRIFADFPSVGMHINYTHGENLILNLADKYPKGYYGWTTAVHAGIFAGGRTGLHFKNGKAAALYAEVGTNEIEVISYAINRRALKPWDILNLGLGVQYFFR